MFCVALDRAQSQGQGTKFHLSCSFTVNLLRLFSWNGEVGPKKALMRFLSLAVGERRVGWVMGCPRPQEDRQGLGAWEILQDVCYYRASDLCSGNLIISMVFVFSMPIRFLFSSPDNVNLCK